MASGPTGDRPAGDVETDTHVRISHSLSCSSSPTPYTDTLRGSPSLRLSLRESTRKGTPKGSNEPDLALRPPTASQKQNLYTCPAPCRTWAFSEGRSLGLGSSRAVPVPATQEETKPFIRASEGERRQCNRVHRTSFHL